MGSFTFCPYSCLWSITSDTHVLSSDRSTHYQLDVNNILHEERHVSILHTLIIYLFSFLSIQTKNQMMLTLNCLISSYSTLLRVLVLCFFVVFLLLFFLYDYCKPFSANTLNRISAVHVSTLIRRCFNLVRLLGYISSVSTCAATVSVPLCINPFMPNVFSHPYQLDNPIPILGLLGVF